MLIAIAAVTTTVSSSYCVTHVLCKTAGVDCCIKIRLRTIYLTRLGYVSHVLC